MVRGSARRRASRMREAALRSAGNDGGGDDDDFNGPRHLGPSPFSRRRGRGYRNNEGGNVWAKLLTKLVTYGIVMAAIKYGKRSKHSEGSKELPPFLSWLEPILSPRGSDDATAARGRDVRTVRAGSAGGKGAATTTVLAYVVPDFLPADVALRWRDGLSYEWNRASGGGGGGAGTAFVFSSSSSAPAPPSSAGGAGADNIEARNETAHAARRGVGKAGPPGGGGGAPIMARWELEPSHPLSGEVREALDGTDARETMGSLLLRNSGVAGSERDRMEVERAGAVHYSAGDFFFLAPDWDAGRQGAVAAAAPVRWHLILSLAVVPSAQGEGSAEEDLEGRLPAVRFGCPPASDAAASDDGGAEESTATQPE